MNVEPTKPYVYQPFPVDTPNGKIYGVAGIPNRMPIRGLDKQTATELCRVMNKAPEFATNFSDGIRKKLGCD